MKELSLRPYPGTIRLCETKKEYRKEHRKLFGYDICLDGRYGRMDGTGRTFTYLIWGCDRARVAHEISHVILDVFDDIGIDPRQSNGEPFCYLLSTLLLDIG